MSDPLDVFDRHRRLLFSVAYQMLGSVADAEDVRAPADRPRHSRGGARPGRIEITDVNIAPAVVAWAGGVPLMTMSLVVTDGLVSQVLVVRNPDKLAHLSG